ncbi:hypothetical protein ATY48_10350 [Xanthomonas oryzae pv. oryzae]|nr:hypothetical protein AZ54_11910 [Xanthomonas oryzae pv. oryzae PXO86]ALZ71932.1 hypothetical protein APZ20_11005 [Xanthomonas oryzae pv. oryzae]AOS02402.1 hypothetical protein ATY42_10335 [Xanthomonas oryzae pv. oryzae]AOS06035.1 hypothetical protein ATY43_07995 [Xanthomonas oryzae pv. oryzae]AOS10782.1 hypothetical protein ATY44_11155 [Xanthomonas oryzae pv. oryzae]
MHHLDVVVDDGHSHVARQQRLTGDLPEAPEADDQVAAGLPAGFFHAIQRDRRGRRQPPLQQHEQRRQCHRQHHDSGQAGGDLRIDDTGCRSGGKQHACELAALRHQHAAIQRLPMVAAHQPRHRVDACALAHHQSQHARYDQAPIGRDHA